MNFKYCSYSSVCPLGDREEKPGNAAILEPPHFFSVNGIRIVSYSPLFRTAALLLVLFIIGCSTDTIQNLKVHATLVSNHDLPSFTDDLGLEGLSRAVRRQLAVLRKEDDREALRIGEMSYRTRQLLASMERFNQLVTEADACLKKGDPAQPCSDHFSQQIRDEFLVYRLYPSLLTAYYTPTIEVSTQQTEKYRYPIYRTPDKAWERRLSRDDIDFSGKLEGKGYELFYAADLFDLYNVMIEGGARVIVNDDGYRYAKYLHYNTSNEQEFTNIDDYMLSQGMLKPGKTSRWYQRSYLLAHPDRVREIFSSCPGYVFFRASDVPPITSSGAPLTENRSLATDPAYYPVKGLITYVVAPLPVPPAGAIPAESNPPITEYHTMQRFFIDQDIGHHILGPARADLFFGEDAYAEFLASNFMTKGTIYLLILKERPA